MTLKQILERIDIRVPRNREEISWRLALFFRFRSHLINRDGNKVHKSWEELKDMLEWTDEQELKQNCDEKIQRAFDN